MLIPRLLPWAAALLLAGCASSTIPLQQPQQALPTQWPGDTQTRGNTDAALPPWQAMVVDPALTQLLQQAASYNHDLRQALLRAQEARASYGIENASRFPTLAAGSSHARARVPGDLNASGRAATGSDHEVFVGLSSWELDLWGRVRNLSNAALQQYLATELGTQAARQALFAQVARSYLTLREMDERLTLTRHTLGSRAETLRIFTRRYEVGSISKYALTQVESLHHQARAMAAQLEQERAQTAHALQLLTGADVAQLPPLVRGQQFFADVPVGLPSSLLTARPDVVAAEHQLQASHARVDAARAAFLPRIALSGSLGTASAQLDGLFDNGSKAWSCKNAPVWPSCAMTTALRPISMCWMPSAICSAPRSRWCRPALPSKAPRSACTPRWAVAPAWACLPALPKPHLPPRHLSLLPAPHPEHRNTHVQARQQAKNPHPSRHRRHPGRRWHLCLEAMASQPYRPGPGQRQWPH